MVLGVLSGCGVFLEAGACVQETDAGCAWEPTLYCGGNADHPCSSDRRFVKDAGPSCVAIPWAEQHRCL